MASRASGQRAAASSARRSTPGPRVVIRPSTLQDGQAVGIGLVAPHWWQTRRLRKRCSTMRASHCVAADLLAAGAAEGERGVAAAVEEEERLLAGGEALR